MSIIFTVRSVIGYSTDYKSHDSMCDFAGCGSNEYPQSRFLSRRGDSNEYPQSRFLSRHKKIMYTYPCKPQFYYIKMGFKGAGSELYRHVHS